MYKNSLRYWICQIAGWGTWILLNIIIVYQFAAEYFLKPETKKHLFFFSLFLVFLWSVLSTHLLRVALKKLNWIKLTSGKIALIFIFGTLVTGVVAFYGATYTEHLSGYSFDQFEINERKTKAEDLEKELKINGTAYYNYEKNSSLDSAGYLASVKIKKATSWYRNKEGKWQFEEQRKGRELQGFIIECIMISLWLLIYLVWHYIEKNNKDRLDKLRLEGVVKSLELKTIKSHINPHFIFNALNSIRALVDENPERARTAITELSNILRSSLKADTLETVPLQQELDIVQDYLALEHMRFEERLSIEMDIDPETLAQPLPPMMLQTLVENAIKHGISKNIDGGLIRVCSLFKNGQHELIVQNSGHLTELKLAGNSGFGIQSTQDRLNLLYQGKALFEIKNIAGNMVESKIIMPALPALSFS